jgi:hypothetical protein
MPSLRRSSISELFFSVVAGLILMSVTPANGKRDSKLGHSNYNSGFGGSVSIPGWRPYRSSL